MATIKGELEKEKDIIKRNRLYEKLAGSGSATEALTKNKAILETLYNDEQELEFTAEDIKNILALDASAKYAQIETAENTKEMVADLKSQNDLLKKQYDYLVKELENIFGSSEDSNIVQKDIFKIVMEQNKGGALLLDKGLDVIFNVVIMAIQSYLASRGIRF